jgi:hypothetical protein
MAPRTPSLIPYQGSKARFAPAIVDALISRFGAPVLW